jgi:hypothetical protein
MFMVIGIGTSVAAIFQNARTGDIPATPARSDASVYPMQKSPRAANPE